MSGYGTKRPVGVALHETALETKESFVVRVTALFMRPIADIASGTARRGAVAVVSSVASVEKIALE